MGTTIRHCIWAIALVLTISAIAYCNSQSDIEWTKKEAFLGKACFDAGGLWNPDWRRVYYCERPKSGVVANGH